MTHTSMNPFMQRGPIRNGADFIGRERLIAQILAFLARGQCVSLVGPRRIGKTSVAFQCARPEIQQAHEIDPQRICWVFQSCENWEGTTPEELYLLLADAIAAQVVDSTRAPTDAGSSSYRQLELLIRMVTAADQRIVVVLDEFDLLSRNPDLGERFFTSRQP